MSTALPPLTCPAILPSFAGYVRGKFGPSMKFIPPVLNEVEGSLTRGSVTPRTGEGEFGDEETGRYGD